LFIRSPTVRTVAARLLREQKAAAADLQAVICQFCVAAAVAGQFDNADNATSA
jgi:hypothetical protein